MKKFKTLVMAVALAMSAFAANAADGIQTIAPYDVDFNTSFSTSGTFVVSKGWSFAKLGSSNVTFTYKSSYGVDGSGCLQCGSQSPTSTSYNSIIITPAVTGTSSLMVKNYSSYSSGSIAFYKMTKNEAGAWVQGDEIAATADKDLSATEWATYTIPAVENEFIGIRGNYVYIDNFAAQSVNIELFKNLTVSNVKLVSSAAPDCDAQGNFTVKLSGTITNSGDLDFNVGDEGFTYSIAKYVTASPYEATPIFTKAFEAPLAVGEAANVEIETTINTANYPGRLRYDLVEGWKGTGAYGAWVEPTPYEPILRVYNSNHYTIKESGNYQTEFSAFGKITEDLTKTVTIGNVGAAPMVATITAPAGFELSATTLEVAPHAEESFTITAKASAPGIFSGNLTIANGEFETVNIPVTAIVLDPNKFFENFNGDASVKTLPQGWVELDGKSQWTKTDFTSSSSNNFVHNSTYTTQSILATPLLKVEEGEKMVFDAARKASSYSEGMDVSVYYSADRQNWTLAKKVSGRDMQYFANTQSSPTSQKWTTFTVEGVPAGNYYIGFESGYCSIDDVYGFERVAVAHDVLVKTKEIAKMGDVNSEYIAKVNLFNLNNVDEAEGAYTATMTFDGEEVATAEAVAIAAGATVAYEFAFTPHAAGTFPLEIKYEWADGYNIVVQDTITVRAESSSHAYTVGEFISTNNGTPLTLNYKNSVTETLYTAEQLAAAGIKAGDKITSLSYNGYNTAGELTTHVKTFIMNCDDTEFGAADMTPDDDMTLVYDADVTFAKKGSSSATELMFSVAFSEPFVYTGGALRIKMQSEADSYKNIYFQYDNVPAQCYGQKSDGQKVAQFTSYSECKFPVTTFGIEVDPETLTGKVVDNNGNGIAGVSIVLTAQAATAPAEGMMAAPVVQYSTVTAEDGSFELPIVQTDKTYAAVFTHDEYYDVEMTFSAPFGAINDVVMEHKPSTGINDVKVNASKAYKTIENGEIIIVKDGVKYNVMGQPVR